MCIFVYTCVYFSVSLCFLWCTHSIYFINISSLCPRNIDNQCLFDIINIIKIMLAIGETT